MFVLSSKSDQRTAKKKKDNPFLNVYFDGLFLLEEEGVLSGTYL